MALPSEAETNSTRSIMLKEKKKIHKLYAFNQLTAVLMNMMRVLQLLIRCVLPQSSWAYGPLSCFCCFQNSMPVWMCVCVCILVCISSEICTRLLFRWQTKQTWPFSQRADKKNERESERWIEGYFECTMLIMSKIDTVFWEAEVELPNKP